MAEDLGDKTEAATPHRLSEAREDGRIAKSTDLAAAIELFGAFVLFLMFGVTLARAMAAVLRRSLESGGCVGLSEALDVSRAVAIQTGAAALPPLGLICVIAFASQVSQFGIVFTTKPLMPRLERLNPMAGLGRLFNRKSLAKTIVNTAKLLVVGLVGVLFLRSCVHKLTALPMFAVFAAWAVIGKLAAQLAAWLLTILVVLGLVDYVFQRWQHQQDLRMTKEDVKDERRSMEGDPQIKGKRLRLARQIALQRINAAVPRADVVVTNPTHYSVAIRYDEKEMHAPRVVAKGADEMAMRIREIARINKVPIIERPPLARALYKAVTVGQEVRPEFYEAVAEVLAFVYRLDRNTSDRLRAAVATDRVPESSEVAAAA